jgi:peptidoglycan/LPS O-acetylase OafA/YrhL
VTGARQPGRSGGVARETAADNGLRPPAAARKDSGIRPNPAPERASRSRRIANIQALRGIAVLLVVAFHLLANEPKYGRGFAILPPWLSIGASGVDVFFAISGFVMVSIARGQFRQSGAIPRFLYHRVTRIYPAYWFYSLIMLAIFLAQQAGGTAARTVNLAASFLLLPQPELPLLVVGWTLVHEVYFYLMFALFLLFPERRLPWLLAAWGALAVAGRGLAGSLANPWMQVATNPLTLEFIGGAFAALACLGGRPRAGWLFLAGAVLWWSAGYGLAGALGHAPETSDWLRVLAYGVPSVLALYGLVALELGSGRMLPAWLVGLGDASYSIYLSHLLVIATLGRIWEKSGQTGVWTNALVLGAMVVSVVAFGLASYRFLERPLLALSRRHETGFIGVFRKHA